MSEHAPFGFQTVPLVDKQSLVNDVFHSVAGRYDFMNDAMSGGVHRLWKSAMVSWLAPPRRGRPFRVLDMAGGTADIALRIGDRSQGHACLVVADINPDMLAIGEGRWTQRGRGEATFVEANAEDLPFPEQGFDAYTIAFGIRNVPRMQVALEEAYRVLKPGGRFLCLEFSQVDVPVLDRLYELYSFNVIPALGGALAGDSEGYHYLVESIRTFPNQERFAAMIGEAGFSKVSYRNMSGGIAALHSGWKV